jgi:hypothetical protein
VLSDVFSTCVNSVLSDVFSTCVNSQLSPRWAIPILLCLCGKALAKRHLSSSTNAVFCRVSELPELLWVCVKSPELEARPVPSLPCVCVCVKPPFLLLKQSQCPVLRLLPRLSVTPDYGSPLCVHQISI